MHSLNKKLDASLILTRPKSFAPRPRANQSIDSYQPTIQSKNVIRLLIVFESSFNMLAVTHRAFLSLEFSLIYSIWHSYVESISTLYKLSTFDKNVKGTKQQQQT